LGERSVRNAEVEGSIPFGSTRLRSRPFVENEACHGVAEIEAGHPGDAGSWSRTTPWQATKIPSTPSGAPEMAEFQYVYILVSRSKTVRHYTGLTSDLDRRLRNHNAGQVPHTAKHRPWRIETAIAFRSRRKARNFEAYLKSHSGRAFAKKHF
jgi:putative endonuclease